METPLRILLKERIPEILPDPANYPSWEEFILSKLEKSIEQLLSEHNFDSLDQLTWGTIHRDPNLTSARIYPYPRQDIEYATEAASGRLPLRSRYECI